MNVPEQPAGFEARQVEDQLELSWIWPLRTTSGELLRREIAVFEIFALDVAQEAPPAEVLSTQGEALLRLNAGDLDPAPGETVRTTTSIAAHYGKKTAVAVRARTSREKLSPWSVMTVLEVVRPPAAPEAMSGETVRDGVELAWNAVELASTYLVERRLSREADFQTVGRAEEPRFLDRAVLWEHEHEYRVRAEAPSATGNVAGPASTAVRITVNDVFPPEQPQGLRAVAADASVELTWAASRAFDLAGYIVLRDGSPAHEGLLQSPAFSDRKASGQSHEYKLVAVDRAGNRSEPSESVVVSLR